jgi:glycosyltransferase involved in cell wall biosynthesis
MPRASEEDRRAARTAVGVPQSDFVVGCSFSMASNFERKNPLAAIEAFQIAFPAALAPHATLVLRCSDHEAYPAGSAKLRARATADPRIRLTDRDAGTMSAFYHALDVFVSLHRSEGFGLQIVEALDAGLPVVGTGWSLSAQISARPGFHAVRSALVPVQDPQKVYAAIDGAIWAEPDINEAARLLSEIGAAPRS